MGMTIDEIEQWARQNNYTIVSDNWWYAAQDIINKYQKIEEIVTKWHNDPRMKMTTSYYYMAKITEVLDNGNDD